MTNEEVLRDLLTTPIGTPLKVPTDTLRDWIARIPRGLAYRSARDAYLARVPGEKGFFARRHIRNEPDEAQRKWLVAEFNFPAIRPDFQQLLDDFMKKELMHQ